MLEDLGHRVIEANSGKRALEIIEAGQTIDLMVTDQAMPEMTGIQLAEIVRVEAAQPAGPSGHRLYGSAGQQTREPPPPFQALSASAAAGRNRKAVGYCLGASFSDRLAGGRHRSAVLRAPRRPQTHPRNPRMHISIRIFAQEIADEFECRPDGVRNVPERDIGHFVRCRSGPRFRGCDGEQEFDDLGSVRVAAVSARPTSNDPGFGDHRRPAHAVPGRGRRSRGAFEGPHGR